MPNTNVPQFARISTLRLNSLAYEVGTSACRSTLWLKWRLSVLAHFIPEHYSFIKPLLGPCSFHRKIIGGLHVRSCSDTTGTNQLIFFIRAASVCSRSCSCSSLCLLKSTDGASHFKLPRANPQYTHLLLCTVCVCVLLSKIWGHWLIYK